MHWARTNHCAPIFNMEPVWAPRVLDNLTSADLQLYLDFSSSACIKGGACSVDTALQVLYQSEGDIKLAVQRLIHGPVVASSTTHLVPAPPPTPTATPPPPPLSHCPPQAPQPTTPPPLPLPPTATATATANSLSLLSTAAAAAATACHPPFDTPTTKTDTFWTRDELHLFERLFAAYGKNFSAISRDLRSKSTKECIEHYYLWKKSSTRTNNTASANTTPPRRVAKHEQDCNNNNHNLMNEHGANGKLKQEHPSSLDSNNNATAASPAVVTSTTSASPGAGVIAMKLVINPQDQLLPGQQLAPSEQFPCKVCGRVFLKIKSRSAHMKRHKNER